MEKGTSQSMERHIEECICNEEGEDYLQKMGAIHHITANSEDPFRTGCGSQKIISRSSAEFWKSMDPTYRCDHSHLFCVLVFLLWVTQFLLNL